MDRLVVPRHGITLQGPPVEDSKLHRPPTAIAMTLTNTMIEDMIRCVQNHKPMALCLGDDPVRLFFVSGRRWVVGGPETTDVEQHPWKSWSAQQFHFNQGGMAMADLV